MDDQNAFDGCQFVIEQKAAFAELDSRDARIERRFGPPVWLELGAGRGRIPQVERQIDDADQATELLKVATATTHGCQRQMIFQ
ncbi:hypothetical protein WK92_24975 [Burkholderia ubonensis]|nr:hypothetical protein WK92_24975 [Burkholderia ubonensis]